MKIATLMQDSTSFLMPLKTFCSIILHSHGLNDIPNCLRVSQDPLGETIDVRELVHTWDGYWLSIRWFVSGKRRKVFVMQIARGVWQVLKGLRIEQTYLLIRLISAVNRIFCRTHHRILLAIKLPVSLCDGHLPIPLHLFLQSMILPADPGCRESCL